MEKKLFLYALLSSVTVISSTLIEELDLMEKTNQQNKMRMHCEAFIKSDEERINKTLEAFYLSRYYSHVPDISRTFHQLCKSFLGLHSKKIMCYQEEKYFAERLLFALTEFNNFGSSDLKYLCDMQLNYILEHKKMILYSLKKETVYDVLILAYLASLLFPTQCTVADSEGMVSLLTSQPPKIAELETAEVECFIDINEIGLLHHSFLYKEFERDILQVLKKKKTFYDLLILKGDMLEKIEKEKDSLDILLKKYKSLCLKSNCTLDESFFEGFGSWILEKNRIVNSTSVFLNPHFLFFLAVIIRISDSVSDLKDTYYASITEDELTTLLLVSEFAKFILNELFELVGEKDYFDWEKFDSVVISPNRIKRIVKNITEIMSNTL